MEAITRKAARLARRWDMFPRGISDADTVAALGGTLWFAQVKLNVALAIFARPTVRPLARWMARLDEVFA